MVIGCITESQKLINDAVNAQQEGGNVNMCKALEKLEEKGRQEGELKTKLKLIIKKSPLYNFFLHILFLNKTLLNF